MPFSENLIPLSEKKLIYGVKDKPGIFVKAFPFITTNKNDILMEIELQNIGAHLGLSPPILNTYEDQQHYYIVMKRIKGMSLADYYGENKMDIPNWVWKELHRIIRELFINGIEYIDITPYNFLIEDETEKIYVVDYGHAKKVHMNWFVQDFLNGIKQWNPDFA